MQTDPKEDYKRGFVPFLDTKIYLDSRPLIPRVETEYWLNEALKEIPEESLACVLDLFAGSGCIGLATLKHRPNTYVTFAEIEQNHLDTIKKSVIENELDLKHAFLIKGDMWEAIDGRFDFIFANPPYISKKRGTAAEDVATVEPQGALFADEDGYAYIRKTIEGLPKALANKGICFIEHEPHHAEKIAEQIRTIGFVSETKKDQYGVERYSRIERTAVA